MIVEGRGGVQPLAEGGVGPISIDRTGALIVTDGHGRYYEAARKGNLFVAYATLTAPVIYTTAAGTGGPLIWNGSANYNVSLLAVGMSVSVVTTVAGGLGITGNIGQTSAPTSTTAIDGNKNTLIGGRAPASTAYRVGTVVNAGNFLMPLAQAHTGALTVDTSGFSWEDIGGMVIIPPNAWASIAATATLTTLQVQVGLLYEEIPIL